MYLQLISIKTFKLIALVNDLQYRYFIRCESVGILQLGFDILKLDEFH